MTIETADSISGDKSSSKRLSVERIYQKKTQLEHIILRPDSYIGSVQPMTESMWVLDSESSQIVNRTITYVPGLYKIFDEILVNAADNKQRDPKMDTIKIDILPDRNEIRIYNNGKGIPIVQHKDENMYVPTMIFGHLLTSSNFNDDEAKVTGGRNGYGAKLCNVFSTKFSVETACKEYGKEFRQTWGANMSKAHEAKIKEYSGEDFTRISFSPDLAKFNMSSLDSDTVDLLSRRAYDVAASTKGVKVMLNGKRLAVRDFKSYVELFLKGNVDEMGNQIKAVYDTCGQRWEVAIAVSPEKGFQQMSFVNSIATTKGGRHVDYVCDMIVKELAEVIKRKNKGGISIKPFQIKNHIWLFINCLIVNPTFDSQTKENMTLQTKNFGSKCVLNPKFIQQIVKAGIVETVLTWSKLKADMQLKSKSSSKKTNKLKGVVKLEDANDAGTKNSTECTLILTEGDSAKTLAVAGLSVVGRDKYGVYPLRGKLLNVREATHKSIMDNKEITDVVKIIGLQYKKKYCSHDDLKTLRYGKLMIMTDQDQDGSHIKGLIINFIHHFWPDILKLPFLEEFITPIVKVSKGAGDNAVSLSFFSLPEFYEWKQNTDNWHTFKIKYYKGLGTSTSKEAKEYFSDMRRHRILFSHQSGQDDHAINMAFSKKATEQRKDWLTGWMEECKSRRELGLPEIYLYEKDTHRVTYSDFVNKELILFSNLDNERSIPSLVDGFKPGQRKVMFTCLKRNDKREVKVAQLAGSVGEMSAYHHGEASLMGTIINLAQNYVGSNNINLLQPIGQFGTRLAGGKDHASPRYIFTQLSPLARHLFNMKDDPILKYLQDDNQKIEPEWYIPIIPMVLVNGADGIGTGWMTKIPNYNPREIVENIRRLLRGENMIEMKPWFKGFTGQIEKIDHQRYVINGEITEVSDSVIEITELPIRTWTQTYKEQVMEAYLNGSEKQPAMITDYKEYHTDVTVKFKVTMNSNKLSEIETKQGLHQFFKLQSVTSTTSMVLFDAMGCLKRYDSAEDIIKEFFTIRLAFYEKRKKYLEGVLQAETLKISNQARFILEKCDGSLVIEKKKKKVIIEELQRKGYDVDPVKKWKKAQDIVDEDHEDELSDVDVETDADKKADEYDYLLGMALWSLTSERVAALIKKKDDKRQELDILRKTSKEDMWYKDLDEFMAKLDEVELIQREDELNLINSAKGTAVGLGRAGKGKSSKQTFKRTEVLPSPHGIRVEPRIPEELRTKFAKAVAAKEKKIIKNDKKAGKDVAGTEVKDEYDLMVDEANASLNESGVKSKKMKQIKLNWDAAPKKKTTKRLNVSSDESSDVCTISDGDDSDASAFTSVPIDRGVNRRAAATKKKKYVSSSDNVDDDTDSDFDVEMVKKVTTNHASPSLDDPGDSNQDDLFDSLIEKEQLEDSSDHGAKLAPIFNGAQKKQTAVKPTVTKRKVVEIKTSSNDSSEDEGPILQSKASTAALFSSKSNVHNKEKSKAKPESKNVKPKNVLLNDKKRKTAKPKKKKKSSDDDEDGGVYNASDNEDAYGDIGDVAPARDRPGRQQKKIVYKISSDEDDFE